jgi:hypothetical protein
MLSNPLSLGRAILEKMRHEKVRFRPVLTEFSFDFILKKESDP